MNHSEDLGKLLLRLTIGLLLSMHGLFKLANGIDPITALVVAQGWPTWVVFGVFIGEIIAPALLIIGVLTRVGALVIVVNMGLAIYLAHAAQILKITSTGGWALELPGLFLLGALTVALLGAGRFSLGGSHGRLN
ncbi:MAG: DoxX family protein [Alcaligenaceae bacterium]|nr:DoxX family protein [Alcaligenaceae bacterium]